MRTIALLAGSITILAVVAGCTLLVNAGAPCDVDTDCAVNEACLDAFCTPGARSAAIGGEGEGGEGEGEGAGDEGEGEANEGEGEAGEEGEGEGEAAEGEGEGEGEAAEGEGEAAEGEGEEGEGEGEGEIAPILLSSCAAIHASNGALLSGPFDIDPGTGPISVFCEMSINGGGWTRVVDNTYAGLGAATCPAPWITNASGCTRSGDVATSSALFSVPVPYTEVLGSIQGIAFRNLDAFDADGGNDFNDNYVDGVSVSSGTPRTHLFTLAASHDDSGNSCPCEGGPDPSAFIGTQFRCDQSIDPDVFDGSAPLWDAVQTCPVTSPFWQSIPILQNTNPLEVRVLIDQDADDENIAVSHVELYVR